MEGGARGVDADTRGAIEGSDERNYPREREFLVHATTLGDGGWHTSGERSVRGGEARRTTSSHVPLATVLTNRMLHVAERFALPLVSLGAIKLHKRGLVPWLCTCRVTWAGGVPDNACGAPNTG